jgi:transcriptional regulator GlxA family with amidase domain
MRSTDNVVNLLTPDIRDVAFSFTDPKPLEEAVGRPPEESTRARGSHCKLTRWQLRRVISHIDANISMKLTLESMAGLTLLSAFHFGRLFHNSCGRSPYQFVLRRRVEIAKGMLSSTDRSIAEIALECGLNDQAHLNRLFRSLVGVSPGLWRRHARAAFDGSRREEAHADAE